MRKHSVNRNRRAENFIYCIKIASGGNVRLDIVLPCGIFAVDGIRAVIFFNVYPERPHNIQGHIYVVAAVTANRLNKHGLAGAHRRHQQCGKVLTAF